MPIDHKPFWRTRECLYLSETPHANITVNKSYMAAIVMSEVEFNLTLLCVYLQLNVYLLQSIWDEPAWIIFLLRSLNMPDPEAVTLVRFYDRPLVLQADPEMLPKTGWPVPSTSSPINYSVTIPVYDALYFEVPTESLIIHKKINKISIVSRNISLKWKKDVWSLKFCNAVILKNTLIIGSECVTQVRIGGFILYRTSLMTINFPVNWERLSWKKCEYL